LSRSISFEVRSRRRWPKGIEEIVSDFGPFTSCHIGQPRGLFLIILPDVAEPVGRGAASGVENRPDDGQTSVGMKRAWTSPKGVHQLEPACWSVPLLNDQTPPHGPEKAVPVPRRPWCGS
jgi:hypothetical protein